MSEAARTQRWTAEEMDAHERARALLNAVIAAYSSRIHGAPTPEAAGALREARAPLLAERDTLTADSQVRIAEILRDMPAQLTAVREATAGE
ncbi:hypothetical protein F610DRAFT_00729 [Streptomyces sp. LaPpAH-199]|nr:hypothetical protein F610DRAFT_00729 [Streptomyces sp. LaPpAH-199]